MVDTLEKLGKKDTYNIMPICVSYVFVLLSTWMSRRRVNGDFFIC